MPDFASVVATSPQSASLRMTLPSQGESGAAAAAADWDWAPAEFSTESMVKFALGKEDAAPDPASGLLEPKEEEGKGKGKGPKSAFKRDRAAEAAIFSREVALLDPDRKF